MNKFKFYFILFFISVSLFSCKHDDDATAAPPRDRQAQYLVDKDSIEEYLKTHSMTKVEVNGLTDVVITDLVAGGVSIWDNTEYPLQYHDVANDVRVSNLTDGGSTDTQASYRLYYVILNEGGGATPTTTDSTFVSYRGWKLDNDEFDKNDTPFWATYPEVSSGEISLISGFRQFTPFLKAATQTVDNHDGTFSFTNAGVGVVFIPSGLGYYNVSRTGIPAYSPLAFLVRLDGVRERDHDQDGILTKYEDLNGDGNPFNDNTDAGEANDPHADKIPDFLDTDDDNDGFLTKTEIKNAAGVTYPYELIPTCTGGNNKKRYLDKTCWKD